MKKLGILHIILLVCLPGFGQIEPTSKWILRGGPAVAQKLDSLGRQAKSAANESDRRSLIKLKEELEYADHAMFQWMEEFNLDSAINDDKKRIDYLESEKVKVIKVRDHILNSLSRADSLLRK